MADQGVTRISLAPVGRKALPTRLVLRVKFDASGAYERHKARWVALGFLARIGLEFYSAYSPTTMLATSRILFAVAAKHGLNVAHCDLPQAFLSTPVDRPIWVQLPRGISLKSDVIREFQKKYPGGKPALRLLRALYGLRSSPALSSKRLAAFMSDLGMQRSRSDATLYYYKSVDADGTSRWVLISVFVGDLLITGTDKAFIAKFKAHANKRLGQHQPVTWNETVSSFLGLQINHNPPFTQWTILAGTKISNLLRAIDVESPKPNVRNCWQSSWPETSRKIRQEGVTPELTTRQRKIGENFRSVGGSLIYISTSCRPDIATIVSKSCIGMQDPQYNHAEWIERCLAYLASHPLAVWSSVKMETQSPQMCCMFLPINTKTFATFAIHPVCVSQTLISHHRMIPSSVAPQASAFTRSDHSSRGHQNGKLSQPNLQWRPS